LLRTHRREPDTPLAVNRSTDFRLVAMRGAPSPSTLSRRQHHDEPRSSRRTIEQQMRMINVGLTTILATLTLASSAFAAASGNTKTNTVGPIGPGFGSITTG
jgi:hypothetical protein